VYGTEMERVHTHCRDRRLSTADGGSLIAILDGGRYIQLEVCR
jgi:hypothetical protein